MHLSKSRYRLLRQCPKLLWLDTYHKELRTEDPEADDRMVAGNIIGDLAMGLFGAFTDIAVLKEDGRPDIPAMIEKTGRCIYGGCKTLCEASFSYEGLYCAVDILRKEKGGYAIYEVKSSTHASEIYGVDIAYQKYVLEHCGIKVTGTYLVHIDPHYVRGDELDIKKLFNVVNMADVVERESEHISSRLKEAEAVLNCGEEPGLDIGEHCNSPYHCAYWDYCTRNLPSPSVFNLYRMPGKNKFEYYRKGMVSYEDMLSSPELNKKQLRQIKFHLYDYGTYVDKKSLTNAGWS